MEDTDICKSRRSAHRVPARGPQACSPGVPAPGMRAAHLGEMAEKGARRRRGSVLTPPSAFPSSLGNGV